MNYQYSSGIKTLRSGAKVETHVEAFGPDRTTTRIETRPNGVIRRDDTVVERGLPSLKRFKRSIVVRPGRDVTISDQSAARFGHKYQFSLRDNAMTGTLTPPLNKTDNEGKPGFEDLTRAGD